MSIFDDNDNDNDHIITIKIKYVCVCVCIWCLYSRSVKHYPIYTHILPEHNHHDDDDDYVMFADIKFFMLFKNWIQIKKKLAELDNKIDDHYSVVGFRFLVYVQFGARYKMKWNESVKK